MRTKKTKRNQTCRYREKTGGCQTGGGEGGRQTGEGVDEVQTSNYKISKSGDVMYSTRNAVDNITVNCTMTNDN